MNINSISADWILPVEDKPIKQGILSWSQGIITSIGKNTGQAAEDIQYFSNSVITPGLVNAHTHLEYIFRPKTKEDFNFIDWIIGLIKLSRKFSEEDYYWASIYSTKELLKKGVSTIGNIVKNPSSARAAIDSRMRGINFLEIIGWQNTEVLKNKLINSLEDLTCLSKNTRFKAGLSPHSIYTTSKEVLKWAFFLAGEKDIPLSIHLAESPFEKELTQNNRGEIIDRFWKFIDFPIDKWKNPNDTPFGYLYKNGLVKEKSSLVHCVHLEEEEIKTIKEKKLNPVLCPSSNIFLKVGLPPVNEFVKKSVEFSLGTDSLSSNPELDLVKEYRVFEENFPGQITPELFLKSITLNGAKGLGLDSYCGSLKLGKSADFAIFEIQADLSKDPYALLRLPSKKRKLKELYIAGEKIYSNGQFNYLDEELVDYQINKRAVDISQ